jgi:DNA polymerase-4
MQMRIPYTSLDHVLMEKAKELFDKLYQKRMLIRMIGVRFSHLIRGNYQYDLFQDRAEQLQLYLAMDKMRKRFGKNSIQRAVGMGVKRSDFNPFNGIRSLPV